MSDPAPELADHDRRTSAPTDRAGRISQNPTRVGDPRDEDSKEGHPLQRLVRALPGLVVFRSGWEQMRLPGIRAVEDLGAVLRVRPGTRALIETGLEIHAGVAPCRGPRIVALLPAAGPGDLDLSPDLRVSPEIRGVPASPRGDSRRDTNPG